MEKYLETDSRNKAGNVAYVGQLKIFVSNENKEKIPTHPTLFGRHMQTRISNTPSHVYQLMAYVQLS